jgi:hypothetical protein
MPGTAGYDLDKDGKPENTLSFMERGLENQTSIIIIIIFTATAGLQIHIENKLTNSMEQSPS